MENIISTYKNTITDLYISYNKMKHGDTQAEEGYADHNLNASSNSTTFRFVSVSCVTAADRSGESKRLHLIALNM